MQVYFQNWKSKIAAKRNKHTEKLAYAVGESYSGTGHTIIVTPVQHYNNSKSSGFGGGYHPLDSFPDPEQGLGTYTKPSIACCDNGVLVAAWTMKDEEYMYLRICRQAADVDAWTHGWSTPESVHTAKEIGMICALPAHGTEGVDIYFKAKTIIGDEWHFYRLIIDNEGNYEGLETIETEGWSDPGEESDWTATILGDLRKVILFRVPDPVNSKAIGVLIKEPGSAWTGPFYLTAYIKIMGENGYEWQLWDDYEFEDGYGFYTLWGKWIGGGADKDNIIHVLKMGLKDSQTGYEYVEDIYFRIDIDNEEARGEFLFSEMGIEWDHVHWEYEEALGVEYLTGIPHVWFCGDGGEYSVVYYAKRLQSWAYTLYWDGTREELGACTRDDFGGSIAMIGNHWEYREDKVLRGSVSTITCSITSDKNPYKQSQVDTHASFTRIVTNSAGDAMDDDSIDEVYSTVMLPDLTETLFSNPFLLPQMAVNYILYWSPSYEGVYKFWIGKQTLTFKYLLPDLHLHSVELCHYELDGNPHELSAVIHNQAHPYGVECTDDVPGLILCKFYEGDPDPDCDGLPDDPLPQGCIELGEVTAQGISAGASREVKITLNLEGDPHYFHPFAAVDVQNSVNEITIYDEGEPLETKKNNIMGNNMFLSGVLRLHVGHDKMVYIETDQEVNFSGAVTDAFLIPIEGCALMGQVKIPFQALNRDTDPNPWQDIAGGNYASAYAFQVDPPDPYGFYLYHVEASKQNYLSATADGSFIYGKKISGNISVMPTPEMDSIKKTDLINLVEQFAGADGPLLVTGVNKRNFDEIEFSLEEPEEKISDVIESFSEE